MSDWLFLGERIESDVLFQLAMSRRDGQYYRFEPIATKLRGNSVGPLRQELVNRSNLITANQNQGIICANGPVFYQDRYWLGWKERSGRSLFGSERRPRKPLREELADLYPLINSYQLWRQQGITVGRPEWRRLAVDDSGLFMLDPKAAFYLTQPSVNPSLALERCRPAEEYRNLAPTCYGDLFYLGLIIYYYLTGEIPFSLRKGWPTQNILAGEIINPQLYRPKLPSGLGRLIICMLAPEPSKRPTADVVAGLWDEYSKPDRVFGKPSFNDDGSKWVKIKNKSTWRKAVSKWAIILSVLGPLTFGFSFFVPKFFKRPQVSPLETAAHFYREMGRFSFRTQQGLSTQIVQTDFETAMKRRLEMARALLSKPVFEVSQMRIIEETAETAIIEADLIWWEWSAAGWVRRDSHERLVYRKKGKRMELESRKVKRAIN